MPSQTFLNKDPWRFLRNFMNFFGEALFEDS